MIRGNSTALQCSQQLSCSSRKALPAVFEEMAASVDQRTAVLQTVLEETLRVPEWRGLLTASLAQAVLNYRSICRRKLVDFSGPSGAFFVGRLDTPLMSRPPAQAISLEGLSALPFGRSSSTPCWRTHLGPCLQWWLFYWIHVAGLTPSPWLALRIFFVSFLSSRG